MKRNQKGFGAVEGLLILIIIGLIGFIGWYVYHTKNSTDSTYNNAAKTSSSTANAPAQQVYHDTAVGYTLKLPKGWQYIKGKQATLENGQPDVDYQGNPVIPPDQIMPDGSNVQSTDGIVELMTDKSALSPKDYFNQNGFARATGIESQQAMTINGYPAYTVNFNQPGQGGHSVTTVVTHKGKVVQFFYYADTDMNKNVSKCQEIINSIKFD